jgi:hypothetical protein
MAEDRVSWVSNFCSFGPRPLIMDGIFCELLKQHFSDARNIEHTELTSRLFSQLAEDNEILIAEHTVWTPIQAQRRLAVIVKRNQWQCVKQGTFDNTHGTTTEGFRKHMKMWRGSHTLFAIANEGAEAQILAAEVYRYFNHFGPVFRRYFDLMLFELTEVGPVSQIQEWDDHWGIPITIGYGWSDTWILKPDEPVIATINMSDIFGVWPGT